MLMGGVQLFLLAGVLMGVGAEELTPPLSLSCLDTEPVFNTLDTANNISCLWGQFARIIYEPAAWVTPASAAGPGPVCGWVVEGLRLYDSDDWTSTATIRLPPLPCELTVQCTSEGCPGGDCRHLPFVIRFTEQDLFFFMIQPPSPVVYQLQEVQFGWCARLWSPEKSYLFTRRENVLPITIMQSERTQVRPELLPDADVRQNCALHWFYHVKTRFVRLGQHMTVLEPPDSSEESPHFQIKVLPGFLNIFTATSRQLLPTDSELSVSWTLTPLGAHGLAYQLFDHKNLGDWAPNLDPHAARSDLCFAAKTPAGSSVVDRLTFLIVNQSVDVEQLGRLAVDSSKVRLEVNENTWSIILVEPDKNLGLFNFPGGFYFSLEQGDNLTEHYIFFQRQGPSYLFQFDFNGGALVTFRVHLHMNVNWTYNSLRDMELEIHLFNSGPSERFTLVNVVWFIPLQHPFVQCQWTFVLEFYSAKKVILINNSTYTYKNGTQDAAKYIPKSVLSFNPQQYKGFVATVNCTKSGENPVILKTLVGTHSSKVVESMIDCYKVPCVFKEFHIQKPRDSLPVITMAKGTQMTLYTILEINCPAARHVNLLWKVYQLASKTDAPHWGTDLNIPAISPINKCHLVIPSFTLNFGFYLFNMSVTINTTDDTDPILYQSDSVIVEVQQRALQARIEGGASRLVGFQDSWTLSGNRSADPDSLDPLDGISFKWYCTQVASDYATMTLSQNASCSPLQTDLLWLDSVSPIQSMAPKILDINKQFNFRLVITKGGRRAYADQSVNIVTGTVPKLTLECIENCREVLLPTVRFILTADCLDCVIDGKRPQYKWLLYLNGITEVKFDWEKHSSTGRFKPYMSIDALSFLNTAGKNYTLLLKLTLGAASETSIGYSFFVNSPPQFGNCYIKPDQGTSLVTLFVVDCSGFYDDDQPLVYRVIAVSQKLSRISSLQQDVLGTVVYSGYEPVSLPFYLPIGDESQNYRLPVCVVVYDSLGSFSQVDLFARVTALSSNRLEEVPIDVYLKQGDYIKAGHLMYTVASVLNKDISSVAADNLGGRAKLREHILNMCRSISAVDVLAVNQIVTIISKVTKNSKEINQQSQQLAVDKLADVVGVLRKFRDKIVLSEEAEQLSTGVLTGLSNIIVAALLNADTVNIDTISPGKINVLKQVLSLLETVNEIVMVGNVPGGEKTLMESDCWKIHLKKDEMWDIDSTFITQTGCKNCFQPTFKSAIQGVHGKSIVATVFYEFKENPLPWLKNGRDIQTMVTGFQMTAITVTGDPKNLIPDKVDMMIMIKNTTLVVPVPISIGPDPNITEITSGEIGFEYDTTRAPELLIQLFTTQNIAFNVSLYLGYNYSGSSALATYQTLGRATFTEKRKNGNTLFRIWDPYVINVPLKSITQAPQQGNITLRLWSEFQVPKYTAKLLSISIVHYSCIDFDALSEAWSDSNCKIGPLTNNIQTHCICHFSQPKEVPKINSFFKNIPQIVAAKVWVPPNIVDFRQSYLTDLQKNLITLSTVLFIFALYIVLAVWAKKQDNIDIISKDHVVILPDNDPFDKECYLVTVYTGSRCGAGTTADVFLKLVGAFSESQVHLLKHAEYSAFPRGGLDTFLLTTKYELGDLYFLRIWHNNRGGSPGWYLSRVKVEHMYSKHTWYFICRKWLAVDKADGLIDRTFPVTKPDLPLYKKDFFLIDVSNNFEDFHLWVSIFALVMARPFNRLQRLSCCLAMLMSILLTCTLLYTFEINQIERVDRYIRSLIVGAESSLVTVPVSLLLFRLFRYSRRRHKPTSYNPYLAYAEFRTDEKSIMPNDVSFWVSHVQPRGWKDYLQALYNNRESAKSKKSSSVISNPQTISSSAPVERMFNNCVVSEAVANVIVPQDEETISASTELMQDHPSRTSPQLSLRNKNNQNSTKTHDVDDSSKKNKQNNPCGTCFILSRKQPDIVYSWWCIYVSWAIILIITAASSFFIILYGISFSIETAIDWLLANIISLLLSIFLLQTTTVIVFSALASLSLKYLTHIPWENRNSILEIMVECMAKDSDQMRELHYELVKIRNSKQYRPLHEDEITIMKKRTAIKSKAFSYFTGIVSHFIFLTLVLNLAYSTDDINVFLYNRAIASQLSTNLSNVDRLDNIYIWMSAVFLPLIHNQNHPTFLSTSWSKIVGLPRMRQVRAKHVTKNCFRSNSFVYKTSLGKSHCLHRYGVDEEDKLNYTDYWKSTSSAASKTQTGFTYEYDTFPWIYYSYGNSSIYGTGGYTVYFFPENNLFSSVKSLLHLRNSSWLDENTWAVLTELTTFNPDVSLFCAVSVVFEATPLGIVHARLSVNSFTLMTFDQKDMMQMFTHIIFIGFLFIYIVDEIYTMHRQKLGYLKQVSNLINFGLKSVFFLVVYLQIIKFKLASDLLNFYALYPNQFTPFHAVSSVDETLRITEGFLAFFTILKTLRFARFFYSVRLAQRSVHAALPGICSMALVVAVYFFAYMAFGYLVFGQHSWSHSNLSHSAQTVLAYCVSAFRDTLFLNNRILGGIYLTSFMLVMICIVINLFQAVIISAYDDMKQPVYEEPSDEAEVMAFLVHKLRKIFASLTNKNGAKREPESLNGLLYGQPYRERQQALGLKTKKLNGKKMVYLLI
ncbi:polycystin family receptor for egg jelly [Lissotriton helveticus]